MINEKWSKYLRLIHMYYHNGNYKTIRHKIKSPDFTSSPGFIIYLSLMYQLNVEEGLLLLKNIPCHHTYSHIVTFETLHLHFDFNSFSYSSNSERNWILRFSRATSGLTFNSLQSLIIRNSKSPILSDFSDSGKL